MKLEGDQVSELQLPTDDKASWRFTYQTQRGLYCLSEVRTPTGAHETIEYKDAGHSFPKNARGVLPRVTHHKTRSGASQPEVDVRYTYNLTTSENGYKEGNNFLGANLDIQWSDDGLDNLYKYLGAYLYGSVEERWVGDQKVRSIERRFNQFHLMTLEQTTQDGHVHAVQTTYYSPRRVRFPPPPMTKHTVVIGMSALHGPLSNLALHWEEHVGHEQRWNQDEEHLEAGGSYPGARDGPRSPGGAALLHDPWP
ncbi:hypothetical protein F0U59_22895 [Archangium gephyra]|nr:hypothetical protein F0U59_22895 [Archangium gephyra]